LLAGCALGAPASSMSRSKRRRSVTRCRLSRTHVDVGHVAATPVGMTVTADIELTAIEGRALTFKVVCHDEAGLIGEGVHHRAIIDLERFAQRMDRKSAAYCARS
jgi:fluoroacetyl-CoA thioesterase